MKKILILASTLILTSCATIVNDANVPVALSFSNGKRLANCLIKISLQTNIPGTHMIRRSDDALRFNCETASSKKAFGSIPSEMEGAKLKN